MKPEPNQPPTTFCHFISYNYNLSKLLKQAPLLFNSNPDSDIHGYQSQLNWYNKIQYMHAFLLRPYVMDDYGVTERWKYNTNFSGSQNSISRIGWDFQIQKVSMCQKLWWGQQRWDIIQSVRFGNLETFHELWKNDFFKAEIWCGIN